MSFKKDLKKFLKKYKNEFLTKEERVNFYELILAKYLVMQDKRSLLMFNKNPIIDSFGGLNLEAAGFKYDKKTDSYYMKSKDAWKRILRNIDNAPQYKKFDMPTFADEEAHKQAVRQLKKALEEEQNPDPVVPNEDKN